MILPVATVVVLIIVVGVAVVMNTWPDFPPNALADK